MSIHGTLCPGRERFIDARELPDEEYRRLVGRRARKLVGAEAMPVETTAECQRLEHEIAEHFEKIHLGADFLPARFLADGAERARAVCRIRTPSSLGTGFLVAPGILMTNNHVISSTAEAAGSVAEFGFEEGTNTTLAAIQPERFFLTHIALDYTLVACDESSLGEIVPIALLRDPAAVVREERVSVIQHPRGRRKEVALHENRVVQVLDPVIRYRTDTEPGSSGSPVFNQGWELVALHHAGVSEPDGKALNEGVRISAIVRDVLARLGGESEAETLREALFGVPQVGFFDVEVEVPDFQGDGRLADVGFWNIENFNHTVSDQRVEAVADVVGRLSLDVLGLSEVRSEAMERLVDEMAGRGFALGFELHDAAGGQDLAVLFDRDTTTVTRRDDLLTTHQARLAARTPEGRTAFPRTPLFAECAVRSGAGGEVRFLMVVVHLKAFGGAQNEARRRLAARMLAEIIADVRATEGLSVVLGGDFNDELNTDVFAPLQDAPDLFALTADDAATDAISFVGGSHRSLIDHVVVTSDVALGEIAGDDGIRDDAAIVRLDQSVAAFSDRVSDHVPVVFRMVFPDQAEDPDVVVVDGEQPAVVDGNGASRICIVRTGPNGGTFHIPLPAGATALDLSFQEA